MVPCKAHAEHSGLVDHVRVQLDSTETRGGSVQGGIGEADTRPARDLLGRNAEHGFRSPASRWA